MVLSINQVHRISVLLIVWSVSKYGIDDYLPVKSIINGCIN